EALVHEIANPSKGNGKRIAQILENLSSNKIFRECPLERKTKYFGSDITETKTKINNSLMSFIKRKQYEQSNKYDGLIEHCTPMSVRGLNNVTNEVVQKMSFEGDYSSSHDLFNHEVSSRARASKFARGHTGKSNRSTSLSTKVSAYFGTCMGGRTQEIK